MDKVKNRSGSQKRKVTARVAVNCTPAQKAAILAKTAAAGVSPSALALNSLLEVSMRRTRSPRADDGLMRQFFTDLARARDALKPVEAELGKSGSNLNQIAHVLNSDRAPESVMNILNATLEAHLEVLQNLDQAVRDLLELRTAGMNAMGLELGHGSDEGDE